MNNLKINDLVKYAINDFSSIRDAQQLKNKFGPKITDITDKRKENMTISLASMQFVGQKTYYFKFKESNSLTGEFSLDFLPSNPKEIICNLGNDNSNSPKNELSNFRIQVFNNAFISFLNFNFQNSYKTLFNYIKNKYGNPNESEESIEIHKMLVSNTGSNPFCWFIENNEKGFCITLYNCKSVSIPYYSFSKSIVLKAT
ncbi:MAG: hypothetical protein L6416_03735 [Candidatus Omnitrophica bacterium]|nr:hypothetical protein [Candidatus Omnitrophota bacterium]